MRQIHAYTMIELVLTMTLLGILTSIAVPRYLVITEETEKSVASGLYESFLDSLVSIKQVAVVKQFQGDWVDMDDDDNKVHIQAKALIPDGADITYNDSDENEISLRGLLSTNPHSDINRKICEAILHEIVDVHKTFSDMEIWDDCIASGADVCVGSYTASNDQTQPISCYYFIPFEDRAGFVPTVTYTIDMLTKEYGLSLRMSTPMGSGYYIKADDPDDVTDRRWAYQGEEQIKATGRIAPP